MTDGQITIDEEHKHLAESWKTYLARYNEYWNQAVQNLKNDRFPDIEDKDDAWWPDINNEMERLGFDWSDIEDRFGVGIEHDEVKITITDFMGTDGEGNFAITEDGKTMMFLSQN